MLGWAGQVFKEKNQKKKILLTYLVFYWEGGQADLPHVSVRIMNWFSLTLVNL
jgi:hypothetical protein